MATRSVTVRLGRGLGLLRSRAVIGVLAVVVLAFLLDFGLGWYQQRQLDQAAAGGAPAAESRLSPISIVELKSIAYEPDGNPIA